MENFRLLLVNDGTSLTSKTYSYIDENFMKEIEINKTSNMKEYFGRNLLDMYDLVIAPVEMITIFEREFRDELMCVYFIHDELSYINNFTNKERLIKTSENFLLLEAILEKEILKKKNFIVKDMKLLVQQDLLYDLIREDPSELRYINQTLEILNISFNFSKDFNVIGLNIDKDYSKELYVREKIIKIAIKMFAKTFEAEGIEGIEFTLDKRSIIWLIQSEKGLNWDLLSKRFTYILKKIETRIETKTFMTVHKKPIDLEMLSIEFIRIKNNLRFYRGPLQIDYQESNESNTVDSTQTENYKRFEDVELLGTSLETGQQETFENLLYPLVNYLITDIKNEYALKLELYYRISSKILSYINASNRNQEYLDRFGTYEIFEMSSEKWEDSLLDCYKEFSNWIFNCRQNDNREYQEKLISSLHVFIENNLDSDLTLNSLANLVFLNPIYLSRMYKKITGKKLSEYIYLRKIKAAKMYLNNHEIKIREVASLIGYDSPSHFSRRFKETTGMTPLEYREFLSINLE